jgi:hypothetical protein
MSLTEHGVITTFFIDDGSVPLELWGICRYLNLIAVLLHLWGAQSQIADKSVKRTGAAP